ncbi:GNAT family N-acetyltransferase [Thermomonas flagellata]|uniref:GNAT family N-acetyltransferase n=1 Tax=Thermomonas flagellata TaxID=2888524 RepID=UPI001F03A121|nr:GNAT family N-acetyltransferase [Thermomonas flagellata]
MSIKVVRYSPELRSDWHAVVAGARNAVFQFEREFIEYHGDRFVDMSLLAYMDGAPVAVVPAAYDPIGQKLISHPGLTFGGIVVLRELRGGDCIAVVDAVLEVCKAWGMRACILKPLPAQFCNYPSGDVEYALWRMGFKVIRRDLSSLLPLYDAIRPSNLRRRSLRKARRAGVCVRVESDIKAFHALLTSVLSVRHGIKPVHSADEMRLLMSRFPENISIFTAYLADTMLAGAMVFRYGHVWHTQYLANSPRGCEIGALDVVIDDVAERAREAGAKYLSFGISTEDQGRVLNDGLLWQKESFGARAITHDFMECQLC